MPSLADPSLFAITVAVGCAHVLETVLGFVDRFATTRRRDDPIVSLALLVLVAYLLLAIVAFVIQRGDLTPELEQAAAALSSAVLRWLGNLESIKLTIAFRFFGFELHMIWDIMFAARN